MLSLLLRAFQASASTMPTAPGNLGDGGGNRHSPRTWRQPLYPWPLRRQGGVEARLEFSLSPAEPVVNRASGDVCEFCPQRALPDDRNSPTACEQFLPCATVTLHVGPELGLPELAPGGRIGCSRAARMTMPETAVNEAGRPEAREDEIRCPGKAPNMKPISEATRVERSPQGEFWFRISGGDARHDARAGRLIHSVGHRQSCSPPKRGDGARIPLDGERRSKRRIECRFDTLRRSMRT